MSHENLNTIIEKYLRGDATQEEIKYIEQFEQFAENKMKNGVFHSDFEKQNVKNTIFKNVQKQTQRKPKYWLKVAAMITIFVSLSVGYLSTTLNSDAPKTQFSSYITKEASFGEKLTIILPDGSKVTMNSGSKITYPEKFTDSIRAITLVGEAYFQVVENKTKPFVITSNEITTRVLGTTFNVEAYADQNNIKVTLESGKVKINSGNHVAFLTPSQQAIFNKNTSQLNTKTVDVKKYLEWKEGVLRFEDETLKNAVKKIEKWYNVQIDIENEMSESCKFTGSFKNEDLKTVLKSIVFVKQHIKYDFVANNKIILRGTCTNQ